MKQKIFKYLAKIGTFLVVFVITMAVAERFMNRGNTDMTEEMGPATLPIVYMNVNDEYVNPLHGYTIDMEGNYLRGTITPLKANREVDILVETYGAVISKIGFEVRSKDMTRLIEDTDLESFSYEDDMIVATIPIKDLIEEDTEYMLVIKVTDSSGNVIKYYTRVINKSELYLNEKFSFVKDFSVKTFDKETARELRTYMETNSDGDNTSLGHVNIHSNMKQLRWGDLKPIVSSEKELYLLEIDSLNAVIELDYRVIIKSESYNVKEYFRIKKGNDRIYLMDYERRMSQIFDEDKDVLVNGKILHGILDEKLQWMENKQANIYCFVQENSLFSLNSTNGNLYKIFSFYDKDNNDLRTRFDNHGIKILSVDDAGNVRFIVYGYMNRGRHEGEMGVCIYNFDSGLNAVEEELFFPYYKSFQMLDSDIKALSYINSRQLFYMYIDGSIYRVNMDSKSVENVVAELDDNRFVSSNDTSVIAWQVGDNINEYTTINLFDLDNKEPVQITAAPGEIIIPLGFMESDLIYGVARISDVTTDAMGSTEVPMYALEIVDTKNNLLKDYKPGGAYIVDIAVEDNMITAHRAAWNEELGFYEDISDDQIMNNLPDYVTLNNHTSVITEEMETIYQTELHKSPKNENLKRLVPKHVAYEGSRAVNLEEEDHLDRYYVYAFGLIEGIYTDPTDAIKRGEEVAGVVVDKKDSYIWQNGSRYLSKHIKDFEVSIPDGTRTSTAMCLDIMLKLKGIYLDSRTMLDGTNVLSIIKDNIPDVTPLDLSGCSIGAIQYYISRGTPVLAMVEGDESVLITGYDSGNIIIYNPLLGAEEKIVKTDAEEWFRQNGNRFISYISTKQ